MTVFGGEIQTFTEFKHYSISGQTIASMFYCIIGIPTSIFIGRYLDKHKCYKKMLIFLSLMISVCLINTLIGLHFDVNHEFVLAIIVLSGGPMFSVSVPTYQFVAEVIYPVSEI